VGREGGCWLGSFFTRKAAVTFFFPGLSLLSRISASLLSKKSLAPQSQFLEHLPFETWIKSRLTPPQPINYPGVDTKRSTEIPWPQVQRQPGRSTSKASRARQWWRDATGTSKSCGMAPSLRIALPARLTGFWRPITHQVRPPF